AEILVCMAKLVDRTAIKLPGSDEVLAWTHDGAEDQHLGRMARCRGEGRRAPFECCNALFQNGLCGVHDPGVDIAERLQAEQRGGMVDIVEDEARALVDGRYAGTRCRVGLGSGVNRKRAEPGSSLGHSSSP